MLERFSITLRIKSNPLLLQLCSVIVKEIKPLSQPTTNKTKTILTCNQAFFVCKAWAELKS